MITVEAAQDLLFSLVSPLEVEFVPLANAAGRVLAQDVVATRNQPPFSASSMDGYAMKSDEVELHAMFKVVGEAAAGHAFQEIVGAGQAVRIFTGAPVPEGTDFVVIQENITRRGDLITITDEPGTKSNIRAAGVDFKIGTTLESPRQLAPQDIALMASMNIHQIPVTRKPVVALISTGDELVMPGETPGPDQIIASNTFGLKAMLEGLGAEVRVLPIARDTEQSLITAFGLAKSADLIVTIGGASVGDHDLVGPVAKDLGMEQSFYKIKMRPGKPLMAGGLGDSVLIGLPGNPVSAIVCGHVFLAPVIRLMLGLKDIVPTLQTATLTHALEANGPRQHYMRAHVDNGQMTVFENQDSSLLTVLADANALAIRPASDPACEDGRRIHYLPI
ncbi:molybdopterin molybdenumtransferase MoeA [Phaeobacter gallaeciensis]|uniref:Molybdopterin molybdenumtransferase n=2 Tax=Roseobacteraceae TaxID=2854170 RepID=A0A366WQT0_9RHOB|nr:MULTISPECIES: gephyrin-like molybdotransferase Glp [Roseobacteraceae]MBT3140415.1 molybdopterin molybdotransferase MoeA [Falsiruegeria litorea]MBT8171200.1 molybdopterin molybdotransferase MoeA [Falsiruegeria litorea]RBW51703.1 molybdopterin molybdenumtransferase MoeA [Phaeobacter gallaeciensis]